ncbi:MAG: type II toxin-antitoxin system prevent-host-death family antitoxin [Actinobacteria bacterium]|nr:type II toxin-antitoxin system prevent-host-death family antitoxin [Actinomycetota bacterium]
MATSMGIRQLRDTLTSTIRRVQRGETIEVTHHGAPVAVLTPVPSDRIDRLVAVGDVTRGEPLTQAPRRFLMTGELTASQAIEDDRDER